MQFTLPIDAPLTGLSKPYLALNSASFISNAEIISPNGTLRDPGIFPLDFNSSEPRTSGKNLKFAVHFDR